MKKPKTSSASPNVPTNKLARVLAAKQGMPAAAPAAPAVDDSPKSGVIGAVSNAAKRAGQTIVGKRRSRRSSGSGVAIY